MQHVCLVLSDNVVVVNIDTLGVNSLCLYRQSVYIVFFLGRLPRPCDWALGFGATLLCRFVNIFGSLLEFLFRGKRRVLVNFIKERRSIVFNGSVFERSAESSDAATAR